MLRHRRMLAASLIFSISTVMSAPLALADPPPYAPAHGWRAKHDPYYVGYTGRHWNDDYGIRQGRCDRADLVGTVLGTVVGGAVGSAVGSDNNRLIAILAGAAIGAIIGHEDRGEHGRQ